MSVQPVAIAGPSSYVSILEDAWQQHLTLREANAPTVISLFAGCGGSSLGYSMAGYRELLAVERDPMACATFRLNFPDVPLYAGNIEDLTAEACLAQSGMEPGQLDVLDGSPPCQGFSSAGKRQMSDVRNYLFREYVRFLEVLQPKVLIMENVSGMVEGKIKLVFAEMLSCLKQAGYRVRAWLMNAMYFQVPQSRERLIFLGIHEDFSSQEIQHPVPQRRIYTLREALWNVHNTARDLANACYPPTTLYHKLLQQMRPGDIGSSYHPRQAMFGLKRLRWNRPARTVLREDGGGASCQCCHPDDSRRLTIPELKRISCFPESFHVCGTVGEQWAQMGNCVPPLFMRAIAQHVRTMLDRVHHAEHACHGG